MTNIEPGCSRVLNIDCIEYFNGKFEELEKRLDLKDELTATALRKAEQAVNTRLESMNEFRTKLTSQAATFMTTREYEQRHNSIILQINSLSKLVYVGIGILLVLQVMWKYLI